jgi:hypothetical protein
VASNGKNRDGFGWSVAISGNTILIGVPYADLNNNVDQGVAYIFTPWGINWQQQALANSN